MKLKEYPLSATTAWRLRRLDARTLAAPAPAPAPVIVSLTSIPGRLKNIHLTVRSLLSQTVKPEKIVLWLNDALRDAIPQSLGELTGEVFEIRYSGLTCSHRKLVHSLQTFPGRTIVTCDDDVLYATTWLEKLLADHRRYPDAIIAHECRMITRDPATGELKPYKEWPTVIEAGVTSASLLPIGYGGVLYPPQALAADTCDADLFLRLAPRADDLWFKAMSYLQGTPVRRCSATERKPIPIIGSQAVSLLKTNVREDGNRLQWQAICAHYGLDL